MESCRQPEPESLDYWKKQAKHYELKANDIQQELDEYTENSAQLEKELEASLGQVEKQNRDLEHQNQRQKNDIENLRIKLERSQNETNALENELQALKIEKDKQADYVRELEQKNDDLERGQRVISESVSYIESLLNQAYERNAVLESEVDEVENLRVKLQRATDEARDLKQELKVVDRIPDESEKEDRSNMDTTNTVMNGHISNVTRQGQVETETQTIPTLLKREINGNAMTPSSRVSAINLVGDLLRKVGLERFLCQDCGKVKCSCDAAAADAPPPAPAPAPAHASGEAYAQKTNGTNDTDSVELRNPIHAARRLSGPQISDSYTQKPPVHPPLSYRNSEQPFSRAGLGEGGKLRRSFAVRSREGIENLLGLGSNKKSLVEQSKSSRVLRK